jgi:segregation and condensation protein A
MSDTAKPDTELVVDVDGFEGPIALLLDLARTHKIDLRQISILALAEQYLAFIRQAHALRLELAAEHLVMAAWLAYLKSRLLLPEPPADDEPGAEELAEALAFRLRRLEAMQRAGEALFARALLGRDRFLRGAPEGLAEPAARLSCSLSELLSAYHMRSDQGSATLTIETPAYHSVADAVRRLSQMLGTTIDWWPLTHFLPPQWLEPGIRTSVLAAFFSASLELGKAGRLELSQEAAFGPILLRAMGAAR